MSISDMTLGAVLPSFSALKSRVIQTCLDPEIDQHELRALLLEDPAVTIGVLGKAEQMNCSDAPVTSLRRAFEILGRPVVAAIALSTPLSEQVESCQHQSRLTRQFLKQSCIQGTIASHLAPASADQETWYLCGLLANIGQLAMTAALGEQYCQLHDQARHERYELTLLEKSVLGYSHRDVSVGILRNQNVAAEIVDAIEQQNDSSTGADAHNDRMAKAVYLATQIAALHEGRAASDMVGVDAVASTWFDTTTDRILSGIRERFTSAVEIRTEMPCAQITADAASMVVDLLMTEHSQRRSTEYRLSVMERHNRNLSTRLYSDPVTGAMTRREFDKCKEDFLKSHPDAAILLLQPKNVHRLVRDFGDEARDTLLQRTTMKVRAELRSSDLVARFSDNHLVILVSANSHQACSIAERLSELVNEDGSVVDERLSNMILGGVAFHARHPDRRMIESLEQFAWFQVDNAQSKNMNCSMRVLGADQSGPTTNAPHTQSVVNCDEVMT